MKEQDIIVGYGFKVNKSVLNSNNSFIYSEIQEKIENAYIANHDTNFIVYINYKLLNRDEFYNINYIPNFTDEEFSNNKLLVSKVTDIDPKLLEYGLYISHQEY